ncbi:acetylornithine/N-succinyldiaminopimelate aminotransferase [Natranaerovirga hydrolytica]|uniref:Acetylornithine aminotransferase n=1 Tax=Natranaerovirga hydrolytica TaxID=680378 RepID=A0A4R1N0I8_9FIRM|nr:aspartate aminotransferase family protein [Natranaerovirga hydrolytica]TCK98420.1 acetylornithine/N-succinyldiaminopimelate aminotransferase [Natranaerovirga hydrolytica]
MDLVKKGQKIMMSNYQPFPVVFETGDGVYLYDIEGNQYLDFTAGIAVNALGYQDKDLQEALKNQIDKYTHCSNFYYNEPCIEAAELLTKLSGLDRVFFSNSGSEANEGAIKLARKYGFLNKGEDCNKVISLKQSFHGRTLGSLAATGQTKYHKGFMPLIPGVIHVEANHIEAIKNAIDDNVCAIMLEVIQGEGGINPLEQTYLEQVKALCEAHNIILIFDEVQTGIGRTGELFAFQKYGIQPDIMTLAKGLGAGVPIGAIVAKEFVGQVFTPGDHATTYGGNPLVTTAAKVVLEKVSKRAFLDHINTVGEYFEKQLKALVTQYDFVLEQRGLGLMQGIAVSLPVKEVVKKALANQLLLTSAGSNVVRFVPPLIIEEKHIDEMIDILKRVLKEVSDEN